MWQGRAFRLASVTRKPSWRWSLLRLRPMSFKLAKDLVEIALVLVHELQVCQGPGKPETSGSEEALFELAMSEGLPGTPPAPGPVGGHFPVPGPAPVPVPGLDTQHRGGRSICSPQNSKEFLRRLLDDLDFHKNQLVREACCLCSQGDMPGFQPWDYCMPDGNRLLW